MRKPISALLSILFALSCSPKAFGWGDEGHRAVGAEAALYVKPETLCRVNAVLLGDSMAGVASWADSLKRRADKPDIDPDTEAFLATDAFDDNDKWHFDDLPLGCTDYATCNGFTPNRDVVHMINVLIARLQNPNQSSNMSERNALRMLIHLVGDLHQPLHVGSSYIRQQGQNFFLETNPQTITSQHLSKDVGGNALKFSFFPIRPGRGETGQREGSLHSFWDTELVQRLMKDAKDTFSPEAFGQSLKRDVQPESSWNPQGTDLQKWAAQWATDSLNASRQYAYRNVRITSKMPNDFAFNIERGDVADYDAQAKQAARVQIAKAGFRLAKLLDAIYSPSH